MKQMWIFGLIVLALISCDLNNDESIEREEVLFTDQTDSIFFYLDQPGITTFTNQDDYMNFYLENWPYEIVEEPLLPPPINFEEYLLILIHYGRINSGCRDRVEVVKSIETDGDRIYVTLRSLQGLLGGCDMEVHPYQVVKIDKTLIDVVFEGPLP